MVRGYNINNNFQFNNPDSESQNDILSSYQGRLTPGQLSQIKTSIGFSKQNLPCETICPIEEPQPPPEPPITTFGSYLFSNQQPSQINIDSQSTKTNGDLSPGTGNFTIECFSKFIPSSINQINTVFSIGSPQSFNGRILTLTLELSGSYLSPDISNIYNAKIYFYDITFGPQSVYLGYFSPSNSYFTTDLLKSWTHMALVGINNTSTNYSTFQFFVNGFLFSPIIIQNLSSIYTNPDYGYIQGPQNYNILIPSSLAYPYLTVGNQNALLDGSPSLTNPTGYEFNGLLTNFRWTTDITTFSGGALYRNFFNVAPSPLLPIMYTGTNSTLTSLTKVLLDGNISYNTIYDISPYSRNVSYNNVTLSGEIPPSGITPQTYGSFFFNKFYRTNTSYLNGINGNIPLTPMYIDISNGSILQISTKPFTLEWWQWIDLYTTKTGATPAPQQINLFSYSNQFDQNAGVAPAFIINFQNDTSNNGVAMGVTINSGLPSQNQVYFGSFGNSVLGAPKLYDISDINNKWAHIAFQGDGNGFINMYFNGAPFGTRRIINYNFTNPTLSSSMRLGDWAYNNITPPQQSWATFSGYIAGLKLNIGTMAYNTQFVPPLLPFSTDISSALILNNYLPDLTTQNVYKNTSNYTISVVNPNTNVTLQPFIPLATRAQAPSNLQISFVNKQIFIFFTPGDNGGSIITNYSYSTDGGTTFKSLNPAQSGSSVLITKESSSANDISNTKTYSIMLGGITKFGYGLYNSPLDVSAVQAKFTTFFTAGTYTWTAPSNVTSVQYLLVGGGGGSATGDNFRPGGGGGGGQVKVGTTSVIPNTTYSIVVGAGGAGSEPDLRINGVSGENSTFKTITALGGRGGFGPPNYNSKKIYGFGGAGTTDISSSDGGSSGRPTGPATGGAGGGGGSATDGQNSTGIYGGGYGNGIINNITGQSLEFGRGGYGADYGRENGPVDENYLGYGGGGGASLLTYKGGHGGDGCLILRY